MDGNRFDRMAKIFGIAGSRRASIRVLVGIVTTAVPAHLTPAGVAAACKRPGKKCDRNKDCCTRKCKGGRPGKKSKCRCAKFGQRCKRSADCCDDRPCGPNRRCKPSLICRQIGQSCVASEEECCDASFFCNASSGALGRCCTLDGPCTNDTDCCNSFDVCNVFVGGGGVCCKPSGAGCVKDGFEGGCCSDQCLDDPNEPPGSNVGLCA